MNETGQWIGEIVTDGIEGSGVATLSIEADIEGHAFANIYQGGELPSSRADFVYSISGDIFKATSTSAPRVYDAAKDRLVSAGDLPQSKSVTFSKELSVEGKFSAQKISGTWKGESGATGSFSLVNRLFEQSKADHTLTWIEFKNFCSEKVLKPNKEYLFRGHASCFWSLTTTLHRLRRYDLLRYRELTCPRLAKEIGARLGRRYNLGDGLDLGAIVSLAQHHGFPTPLLDWSLSPYIAAYFALSSSVSDGESARIFIFDTGEWNKLPQPASFANPGPTVSIRDFEANDNPRHLPQQSQHTFSNVADIEGWIRYIENRTKVTYLTIVDIPNSERNKAISDLAYMGVTAASLFPGIDGACRALKERIFGIG